MLRAVVLLILLIQLFFSNFDAAPCLTTTILPFDTATTVLMLGITENIDINYLINTLDI